MVVLLIAAAAYHFISTSSPDDARTPPSVSDVLRAVDNQTSFCWRAEILTERTSGDVNSTFRREITGCVNYDNRSALWRTDYGNGSGVMRAFPGEKFYDINWNLATQSWGVEWNVMNFISTSLKKGKVVEVKAVQGGYLFKVAFNWTSSYSVGSIENGSRVSAPHRMELFLLVDNDGNPVGGNFTEMYEERYVDWGRIDRVEIRGNFTLLGPWKH
ncbi:hypothetical protein A3L11_05825 [Thermococcus siculi]|uniref:Uncharacterized protein n=1 Tax=Thermococcus siculi TaxID=72803 RepID=A0A2Z2MLU2_9EURY|nr:hypothetical protein A3L11_05825 [Thermococcus siculi]